MFRNEDEIIKKRIQSLLATYQQVAGCDWNRLRKIIPEQEIWRFFIDGQRQEPGNRVLRYLSNNIPDLTVKEFCLLEMEDPADWAMSNFMGFLRAIKIKLSQEECEKLKIKDLLQLDGSWLSFEKNEANYLNKLTQAAQEVFSKKNELTTDFIKRLHGIAISDVENVGYKKSKRHLPGEWRLNKAMEFDFEPDDVTADGILEILERNRANTSGNGMYMFLTMRNTKNQVGMLNLDTAGIEALKKYRAILSKEKANPELKVADKFTELEDNFYCPIKADTITLQELIESDQAFQIGLDYLAQFNNETELAEKIVKIVKNFNRERFIITFASEQKVPKTTLQADIENYIKIFNLKINEAKSPYEKLLAITTFIQSCHQKHPFLDGNGRVFTMLLLNFLLIQHGFPPVILKNPGCFNGHSPKELVIKVVEGMENTFKLIQENKLYNVATSDVLNFLAKHEVLQPYLKYFNQVVEIEKSQRAIVKPVLK